MKNLFFPKRPLSFSAVQISNMTVQVQAECVQKCVPTGSVPLYPLLCSKQVSPGTLCILDAFFFFFFFFTSFVRTGPFSRNKYIDLMLMSTSDGWTRIWFVHLSPPHPVGSCYSCFTLLANFWNMQRDFLYKWT